MNATVVRLAEFLLIFLESCPTQSGKNEQCHRLDKSVIFSVENEKLYTGTRRIAKARMWLIFLSSM